MGQRHQRPGSIPSSNAIHSGPNSRVAMLTEVGPINAFTLADQTPRTATDGTGRRVRHCPIAYPCDDDAFDRGSSIYRRRRILLGKEIAGILKQGLGEKARTVPSMVLPDFLVRAFALFDPAARSYLFNLGKEKRVSSDKARKTGKKLGIPRPAPRRHSPRALPDVGGSLATRPLLSEKRIWPRFMSSRPSKK